MSDAESGYVIGKIVASNGGSYDVLIGNRDHPYGHLMYLGSEALHNGDQVVVNFLFGDPNMAFISGKPHQSSATVIHRTSEIGRIVASDKGLYDVLIGSRDHPYGAIGPDPDLSMDFSLHEGSHVIVALREGNPQRPYIWGPSPWITG